MRSRLQLWVLAVVLAAVCAGIAGGVYFFGFRRSVKPADLVSYLPSANATVLYIDVDAIRRSGILAMIAGSKAAQELEYQQFVNATKFDYRQDLDAVAAAFRDGQVFFALRGRFHWKDLQTYAAQQGGSCRGKFCSLPASQPGRHISFYPLRSDVMAMAVSPDNQAAYQVTARAGKLELAPPNQPAWVLVPAAALKNADALPSGTKAYASALQSAQEIVFTLGPDGDHLQVALNVLCRDPQAAAALLADLENTTGTLRKWLAREHQQPNPGDLSGVLVAGAFRREDRRVYGQWPIPRAFVDSLAGGSN